MLPKAGNAIDVGIDVGIRLAKMHRQDGRVLIYRATSAAHLSI